MSPTTSLPTTLSLWRESVTKSRKHLVFYPVRFCLRPEQNDPFKARPINAILYKTLLSSYFFSHNVPISPGNPLWLYFQPLVSSSTWTWSMGPCRSSAPSPPARTWWDPDQGQTNSRIFFYSSFSFFKLNLDSTGTSVPVYRYSAFCRPSDRTVGRPPGPKLELGTGSLEAATLTSDH